MLTPEEVKSAANIALESLKDRAAKTEIAFFFESSVAFCKKRSVSRNPLFYKTGLYFPGDFEHPFDIWRYHDRVGRTEYG